MADMTVELFAKFDQFLKGMQAATSATEKFNQTVAKMGGASGRGGSPTTGGGSLGGGKFPWKGPIPLTDKGLANVRTAEQVAQDLEMAQKKVERLTLGFRKSVLGVGGPTKTQQMARGILGLDPKDLSESEASFNRVLRRVQTGLAGLESGALPGSRKLSTLATDVKNLGKLSEQVRLQNAAAGNLGASDMLQTMEVNAPKIAARLTALAGAQKKVADEGRLAARLSRESAADPQRALQQEANTARLREKFSQLRIKNIAWEDKAMAQQAQNYWQALDMEGKAVTQLAQKEAARRAQFPSGTSEADISRMEQSLQLQRQYKNVMQANNEVTSFGVTRTKEMWQWTTHLSSAAQGAMTGVAALNGNITQLGFSMIFLKFSEIPITAATAGLAMAWASVWRNMEKAKKQSQAMASLQKQIGLVGKSGKISEDAQNTLKLLVGAMGINAQEGVDDAVKAMSHLIGAGIEPTFTQFQRIISLSFATGESMDAIAQSMISLADPTAFAGKGFEEFRSEIERIVPAAVLLKNGTSGMIAIESDLYRAYMQGTDGASRFAAMMEALTEIWPEMAAQQQPVVAANKSLLTQLLEMAKGKTEDPMNKLAKALGILTRAGVPVEDALAAIMDYMRTISTSGDLVRAEKGLREFLGGENIDPNKVKNIFLELNGWLDDVTGKKNEIPFEVDGDSRTKVEAELKKLQDMVAAGATFNINPTQGAIPEPLNSLLRGDKVVGLTVRPGWQITDPQADAIANLAASTEGSPRTAHMKIQGSALYLEGSTGLKDFVQAGADTVKRNMEINVTLTGPGAGAVVGGFTGGQIGGGGGTSPGGGGGTSPGGGGGSTGGPPLLTEGYATMRTADGGGRLTTTVGSIKAYLDAGWLLVPPDEASPGTIQKSHFPLMLQSGWEASPDKAGMFAAYPNLALIPGAKGFVTRGPTAALVGEAGPEAVVPLQSSVDSLPKRLGGDVSITVDLRGAQILSERIPDELVRKVSQAIASNLTVKGSILYTRR